MKRRNGFGGRALATLVVALLATGACDDDEPAGGNEPTVVDESQLDFVVRRADAPPLETMDTSFFAVRGQERRLEIRFQGQGGPGTGSKFLELDVGDESLLTRPDGTAFQPGDSIEIRVTIDPDRYLASFEPSGLRFNPNEPAELEIDYELAEDDDLSRELEFDLWRQEQLGDPWERIGSIQVEELDEIEALLTGFTRFALAIGR